MEREAIKITASNFSISQICGSGQCFRMKPLENGCYQVIAHNRMLELRQDGEDVTFYCGQQDFEEIWKPYFDLEADYGRFISSINPEDAYLIRAAQFGSGIRILKQDLWEMIITFIISQQNHIKRIRRCIDIICEKYGAPRAGFYDFPTPEALAAATEEDLRACGLGYRSKYLAGAARSVVDGKVCLGQLGKMGYEDAKKELLKLPGIGGKVADCVCLFALHHLDAFPVDTHIRQVLDNWYPEGFPTDLYAGYLGVLQQYIFYYDLMGEG